jgi:hypothetical protein
MEVMASHGLTRDAAEIHADKPENADPVCPGISRFTF